MKIAIVLIFTVLMITSCSEKKGVKGSFKLILGNSLSLPMNGGAYLEIEDTTSLKKNLIKLDADNSAILLLGNYNMMFVTFAGPGEHAGKMYCGSLSAQPITTTSTSINVSISETNCSQSKYTELIQKILGNTTSNWDQGIFDQSKWGQ